MSCQCLLKTHFQLEIATHKKMKLKIRATEPPDILTIPTAGEASSSGTVMTVK